MQLKSIINKLTSVFLYTVYRFSLSKPIVPIQSEIGACYKACLGMKIHYSLIKQTLQRRMKELGGGGRIHEQLGKFIGIIEKQSI